MRRRGFTVLGLWALAAGTAMTGVASATPTPAGPVWHTAPAPNPHYDGRLFGVSCSSADACTAVGEASVGDDRGVLVSASAPDFTASSPAAATRKVGLAGDEALLSGNPHGASASPKEKYHPYYGFAIAERWNGTAWSLQKLPKIAHKDFTDLAGVSCPTATECVAVGVTLGSDDYPYSIAEIWNGHAWHVERLPKTVLATGISCPSASECIASAELDYFGTAPLTDKPRPAAVIWNGHRWRRMTLPAVKSDQSPELSAISCPTTTYCTAAGVLDTVAERGGEFAQRLSVLAETWNGHRWTRRATPKVVAAPGLQVGALACASTEHCVLAGFTANRRLHPLLEVWNGARWTRQTIDPNGQAALFGAGCETDGTCTVVGAGLRGRNGAATVAFISNGAAWLRESTPQVDSSHRLLDAVAAAGPTAWTATGYRGGGTLVETS
jgi:hypothetical protein